MKIINILNIIKLFYITFRIKFKYKFKNKKIVLFPSEARLSDILSAFPLYLSIYKAGYKIEIYMPIGSLGLIPLYLIIGVTRFRFILTFRLNKLNFIDYKNVFDFRKYIEASLVRSNRADSFKLIENRENELTKLELKISNLLNNFSKINFKNIHAVFFTDYLYIPQGPMMDYLNKYCKDVRLFTYYVGHLSDTLVINKIDSLNNIRHAYAPPFEVFYEDLHALDSKSEKKIILGTRETLFKYYEDKEWFNWVGTTSYINSKDTKKDSLRPLKNIKDNKYFGIFPHIYWDPSLHVAEGIFDDFKEWFEITLDYILRNTNANIIVKDHPCNLYKLTSIGLEYSSPVKDFIDTFPDHFKERVIYLPPDTEYTTLEIIQMVNFVLTVRGTVGVEACLLGKEVIFAGTGRFSGYKFGLFPQNKEEYFSLIQKAIKHELKDNKNSLYAANYLNILWNKMTFKPEITKTKYYYYKNNMKLHKKISTFNINFIDKKISKLSQWFLKPSSTFLN